MVKREWYRDRYNSKKTWEVVKMVGATIYASTLTGSR